MLSQFWYFSFGKFPSVLMAQLYVLQDLWGADQACTRLVMFSSFVE